MSTPLMVKTKGEGVTLALAKWEGTGAPVLGVHGLTANCRSFGNLAAAIAPAHKLLAYDLRGRGLSDKPPKGYSLMQHCRDIECLLKEEKTHKITLMGHSLGAYISIVFAATYPHLVDKLILIDGGADLSFMEWIKVGAGIKPALDRLGKSFASFDDYIKKLKEVPYLQPWTQTTEDYFRYEVEEINGKISSRINPKHIREEQASMALIRMAHYYPKITCPTLLLRATKGMVAKDDLLLPERPTKTLLKAVPTAKLVNIKDADHYSIVFQPNHVCNEAILDFLAT
jgi:pimeloyl-ACP methyl ester carboxylesterase